MYSYYSYYSTKKVMETKTMWYQILQLGIKIIDALHRGPRGSVPRLDKGSVYVGRVEGR